jgi:hypothetical protein
MDNLNFKQLDGNYGPFDYIVSLSQLSRHITISESYEYVLQYSSNTRAFNQRLCGLQVLKDDLMMPLPDDAPMEWSAWESIRVKSIQQKRKF